VFSSFKHLVLRQHIILDLKSNTLEKLNKDIFLRMLEYADINALAALLGTSRCLAKRLEDREIWRRCISNQGSTTSKDKVARRIFKV